MAGFNVPAEELDRWMRQLPAGTYTLWGVQYEGARGTAHVTVARGASGGELSTRDAAERDAAELMGWRPTSNPRVVSRTITVVDGGWQ
ncbi:hypothetical protein AB0K35_27810 [Micromonospora sp. NPDC053740]|uniref:hypothetical protein n=1 Tax=Micromonospora sp. NPDC053740 TaxID=3155173 RepID=UPI00342D02E1